ncbi:MAG: prephenate dehydratase [Bacteroidota bacterium]
MKAAFQGVHGANSEVAARMMFGEKTVAIPCSRFEDVFEAVRKGKADCGIIPIENSLAGSIHQNYDLLLEHPLHIIREAHIRIVHALMGLPGSSLQRVRRVRSHPQALAQCSQFFARHRGISPEAYFDTAGAAESISREKLADTAALAGPHAAELYGLKILRNHVENTSDNFTRFLALARKPVTPRPGVPTKCSLAFRPARNVPGILFRILGVFSLRDIDLLKIESRPDPRSPFEYLFYVDLAGSPNDRRVANALAHLREVVSEYRLLGAYPMGSGDVYGSIKPTVAKRKGHRR